MRRTLSPTRSYLPTLCVTLSVLVSTLTRLVRPAKSQRAVRILIVVLLALFLSTSVLWQPVGLATGARLTRDAHTSAASPTTNFGRDTTLRLGGTAGERTWIRFSLSDTLPPGTVGSQIEKATLRLWVNNSTLPRLQGPFDVYRVTGAWTETGITHANAPAYDPVPIASNVDLGAPRNFIDIDITNLVKNWQDGVVPNEGVVCVASAGSPVAGGFDSRENTATSHSPELEVTLAGAAVQGPPGPQGPQGPQGPAGPGAPVCADTRVRSADFTSSFSFTCPNTPGGTFLLGAECVNRVTLLLQPISIAGNTVTCAGGGDRNLRLTCCSPQQ